MTVLIKAIYRCQKLVTDSFLMSKYPLKSEVLWLFKDPRFNGLLPALTALGEEWAPQALSRHRSTQIHSNSQIPLRVQQPGVAMGRAVSHTNFWSLVGPLLTSAMVLTASAMLSPYNSFLLADGSGTQLLPFPCTALSSSPPPQSSSPVPNTSTSLSLQTQEY